MQGLFSLTESLNALTARAASLTSVHKVIDYGYTGLINVAAGVNFFSQGWGNLDLLDTKAEYEYMRARSRGEGEPLNICFKLLHPEQSLLSADVLGVERRTVFRVWQGEFQCPLPERLLRVLPRESRTARIRMLEPIRTGRNAPSSSSASPSSPPPPRGPDLSRSAVLHLPATGDHGFSRRVHLALPLLHHGVTSVILEGPYYGSRRPEAQVGSKLHHVSDLFLLGRTTIEEAVLLLNHMRDERGATKLGLTGLSMGGVHACLSASVYDGPVSATPCLAPHSAAGPYSQGALSLAVDFTKLLERPPPVYPGMRRERFDAVSPPGGAAIPSPHTPSSPPTPPAPQPTEYLGAGAASFLENLIARNTSSDAASTSGRSPGSALSGIGGAGGYQTITRLLEELYRGVGSAGVRSLGMGPEPGAGGQLSSRDEARVKKDLHEVMDHFTSVALLPPPRCPEAAVIVAATEDAYVDPQSAMTLAQAWPGSELRMVPGGHVTSFLMNQGHFRRAIVDGLSRVPVVSAAGVAGPGAAQGPHGDGDGAGKRVGQC